jgi:hypothetical protein
MSVCTEGALFSHTIEVFSSSPIEGFAQGPWAAHWPSELDDLADFGQDEEQGCKPFEVPNREV